MFEDIRLEDIAQLVEACDTASRQNKKRFVFRENVYTVSRCESFLSETFESLDLKSEDAGASISKKMSPFSDRYRINIVPGEDDPLIIAAAVIIDMINHNSTHYQN